MHPPSSFSLAILSDLHLERSVMKVDVGAADVVAVVGDVLVPTGTLSHPEAHHPAVTWLRQHIPDRPVFYVPGNHDYEGTCVSRALQAMRRAAAGSNIQVLWNETAEHKGVRFIGTPFWSDPGRSGASAAMLSQISRDTDLGLAWDEQGKPLDVHWLMARNREARSFVARELARDPLIPKVVLTHWAPSKRSQDPHWQKSSIGGYWASNHEDLVARAHLWVHGHIHSSADYRVGDDLHRGRVLSNPRGTSRFAHTSHNPKFRQPFLVDVPVGPS